MASPSSFWSKAFRDAIKSSVFIAKIYCFLHVTTNHLGFMAYAYGPSMTPTLHSSGNVLLAEQITKRSQKPSRGDIVVIRSPENPNKTPIKRVIGIEGDRISFVIDPRKNDQSETIVVPKGHVFVQGDYMHNSRDSRNFGPIPYGLIQGRVLWRVWPFQDFGPLEPTLT
ncbi:Mitochondrial ATP-independent inner membrane protease subunit 1b [Cardamine amara subsp. amara]|uniref:Mitochondrial ATP-independent inner membrane protease subunit 1b n=1 Tax=Cardamine amara subsp. amara TaxID=228776 RepID=A0ABD0ZXR5_CARAN